jgi:hypothetical protein
MAYQRRIDPARLVFIDETWAKSNMASLRGWAPCGQRLPGKAAHRRREAHNLHRGSAPRRRHRTAAHRRAN